MKINLKNEYTIAAGKLALIAVVGILLVCVTYISLHSFLKENKANREFKLNKELFPDAANFVECEFTSLKREASYFYKNNIRIQNKYYEVKDNDGNLKGYITFVYGNGFYSDLPLCVAFTDTLQIHKVLLLPTRELKGKCWEDNKLLSIFQGCSTDDSTFPPVTSGVDVVDSISGATVTFNGIVDAIREVINVLSLNKGK